MLDSHVQNAGQPISLLEPFCLFGDKIIKNMPKDGWKTAEDKIQNITPLFEALRLVHSYAMSRVVLHTCRSSSLHP
jgi:hypothetical protein